MLHLFAFHTILASGITIQIGNNAWTLSSDFLIYLVVAAIVGLVAEFVAVLLILILGMYPSSGHSSELLSWWHSGICSPTGDGVDVNVVDITVAISKQVL
jgi:hypothetical protein